MDTYNDLTQYLFELCESSDEYINMEIVQGLLYTCFTREEVVALVESNKMGLKNRCIECGVDMGYQNPRQLCGKTICVD
jgi:hypothetical protein